MKAFYYPAFALVGGLCACLSSALAQTPLQLNAPITEGRPGGYTYVIPPGAREIAFDLYGGDGGGAGSISSECTVDGGRGGVLVARFCVDGTFLRSGDLLRVGVGVAGGYANEMRPGGFGFPPPAELGGGGGGSSGVWRVRPGGERVPLAVAGGGGGGYIKIIGYSCNSDNGGDAVEAPPPGRYGLGGDGRRGGGGGGLFFSGGDGACERSGGRSAAFQGEGGETCYEGNERIFVGVGGTGFPAGGGGGGGSVTNVGGGGGGGASGGRDGGNSGGGDGGSSWISGNASVSRVGESSTKPEDRQHGFISLVAYSGNVGDCTFTEPPAACPFVSRLKPTGSGPTSVSVTWDADPTPEAHEALAFEAGVAPTPAVLPVAITRVTGNAATLTGLAGDTEYDVYVRSICAGQAAPGGLSAPVRVRTSPTCGQRFYDSGGPDEPYGANEDFTTVVCREPGTALSVAFETFQVDGGDAYMNVYDGADATAPFVQRLDQYYIPGTPPQPPTFTASGDCLTFVFHSGTGRAYGLALNGYAAEVVCTPVCENVTGLRTTAVTSNSVSIAYEPAVEAERFSIIAVDRGGDPLMFDQWLKVAAVSTPSATLTDLPPSRDVDIYVKTVCAGTNNISEGFAGPLQARTLPPCLPPTGLAVEAVTASTVSVRYDNATGTSIGEAIAVRRGASPYGEVLAKETSYDFSTGEHRVTLGGLPAGTDIDVYARDFCNDGAGGTLAGPLAGPVPARTAEPPRPTFCDDAPALTCGQTATTTFNTGTTLPPGLATACAITGEGSWYRIEGNGAMVSVSAFENNISVVPAIAVFEGCAPARLIGCNATDAGRSGIAGVHFGAAVGKTYYAFVGASMPVDVPDNPVSVFMSCDPQTGILTDAGCGAPIRRYVDGSGSPARIRFATTGGLRTVAEIDNTQPLGFVTATPYVGAVGTADAGQAAIARTVKFDVERQPTGPVGVGVYVKAAEVDALLLATNASAGDLRFAKASAAGPCSPTVPTGAQSLPATATACFTDDYLLQTTVSSFSAFFVTAERQAPVPVELTRFAAFAKTDHTLLAWATATEVDFDYFAVERSGDGASWRGVGEVLPKGAPGANDGGADYAFRDERPLAGVSYYRLAMYDEDGSVAYSKTASVSRDDSAGAFAVELAPNPATDEVTVRLLGGAVAKTEIAVVDAAGRLVHRVAVEAGDERVVLNVGHLPAGMYAVRATSKVGVRSVRLVLE